MLYGRDMIALIYVDDVILSGPDQYKFDEVIAEIEDTGISLTVQEDVQDFLRVEVKTDKNSGKVTLTKGGLKRKLIKTVGMLNINNNTTP